MEGQELTDWHRRLPCNYRRISTELYWGLLGRTYNCGTISKISLVIVHPTLTQSGRNKEEQKQSECQVTE